MNFVTRFFLGAKHWQVFLLIFGPYCAGQALAMKSMFTGEPTAGVGGFGILFWFLMALFGFCFLSWFWAMGWFLESIVRPELKLKMGLFRFAVIYTVLYALFFFRFVLSTPRVAVLLVAPLHLLAMFCLLYMLYFNSKSLALVEKKRPVKFSDYAGSFFLLWFFLIGVWIIQPKINRLYGERSGILPKPG
jgi:hypothetical protein